MDEVNLFHVYAMKEPDYIMCLMLCMAPTSTVTKRHDENGCQNHFQLP